MASLPKSYKLLVEALSIQHQENPKSTDPRKVIQTIQESFDRSQFEEAQTKATENAMLAKGGEGKGESKKKSPDGSNTVGNSQTECWNCSKKGHRKAQCTQPKKDSHKSNKGQEVHTSMNDEHVFTTVIGEALSKIVDDGQQSCMTIYDSGASRHVPRPKEIYRFPGNTAYGSKDSKQTRLHSLRPV
jgi:hypothetical protein